MNKQIVFVWVSYGGVKVYRADTQQEMRNIFYEITGCLDDWGMENEIAEAEKFGENGNWERAINNLLDVIDVGSHGSFETGTGFNEIVDLS